MKTYQYSSSIDIDRSVSATFLSVPYTLVGKTNITARAITAILKSFFFINSSLKSKKCYAFAVRGPWEKVKRINGRHLVAVFFDESRITREGICVAGDV